MCQVLGAALPYFLLAIPLFLKIIFEFNVRSLISSAVNDKSVYIFRQGRADLTELSASSLFGTSDDANIVAFWSISASGDFYPDIIKDQLFVLESSGLLEKLTALYYFTAGEQGKGYRLPTKVKKIQHISYLRTASDEIYALHSAWQYCHNHPRSKVLYFHNKGGLFGNQHDTNFRKALDCFVLNSRCLEVLDTHDVCGWRLSMMPHVHFSGNYWWATCAHINRLVSPLIVLRNITAADALRIYPPPVLSSREDRYALLAPQQQNVRQQQRQHLRQLRQHKRGPNAIWGISALSGATAAAFYDSLTLFVESWITGAPNYKPADCLNSSYVHRARMNSTDLAGVGDQPNVDAAAGRGVKNAQLYLGGAEVPLLLVSRKCPNWSGLFNVEAEEFNISTAGAFTSTQLTSSVGGGGGGGGVAEQPPLRLRFGLPCGPASLLYEPAVYRAASLRPLLSLLSRVPAFVWQTEVLYGSLPVQQLQWIDKVLYGTDAFDPTPTPATAGAAATTSMTRSNIGSPLVESRRSAVEQVQSLGAMQWAAQAQQELRVRLGIQYPQRQQ